MDLSFSLRGKSRRWRRREHADASPGLPLLFAQIAAQQGTSVTARLQAALDRSGLAVSPFEQRIAILTGSAVAWTCPTCASFASDGASEEGRDNSAATFVKPAFTLALQGSFKYATVQPDTAEHSAEPTPERSGAAALVSRPR